MYSSNRCLSTFQLLPATNSTVMNILVWTSLWTQERLGYIPTSGIAGLVGLCMLNSNKIVFWDSGPSYIPISSLIA